MQDPYASAVSITYASYTNKRKENSMEDIAKLLREAYKLIQEADTTDIDAFYLAVEEAQGYIAEALDLVDESDFIEIPK